MAESKARINLYSPVLGSKSAKTPERPWWLLGLALVIVLFIAGMAAQLVEYWKLTQAIKAREADRAQVLRDQKLLDDKLNLLTSGLSAQVTTASAELVEVINNRLPWVDLFQEMSVRVPDGVWLLRVEVEAMAAPKGKERTRPADKRTIVLSGFARSHQNVGQLLTALEQSPKFKAVSLKFADRRSEKTGEQVNFEISGQLS
ncbi:MAG: PilN domain-containing protein [Nitrospirota bacterium]